TRQAVIAAQRNASGYLGLSPKVLRDAVWLLWPQAKDGVNRVGLRDAIKRRLGTDNSTLRGLIDAWLLGFDKNDDSFVDVGRQIDRHLAANHSGLLALWKESHGAYDIFDAVNGPDRLASRILADASGSVLAACRLDIPSRAAS